MQSLRTVIARMLREQDFLDRAVSRDAGTFATVIQFATAIHRTTTEPYLDKIAPAANIWPADHIEFDVEDPPIDVYSMLLTHSNQLRKGTQLPPQRRRLLTRDFRMLDWRYGGVGGARPRRRVSLALSHLTSPVGDPSVKRLARAVYRDGHRMATIVAPFVQAAVECHDRMKYRVTEIETEADKGNWTHFLVEEYFPAIQRLIEFLPADDEVDDTVARPPDNAPKTKRRAANANSRMITLLEKCPEAKSWSVEKWCQVLGYKSKSTIANTRLWKVLMQTREGNRKDQENRTEEGKFRSENKRK